MVSLPTRPVLLADMHRAKPTGRLCRTTTAKGHAVPSREGAPLAKLWLRTPPHPTAPHVTLFAALALFFAPSLPAPAPSVLDLEASPTVQTLLVDTEEDQKCIIVLGHMICL